VLIPDLEPYRAPQEVAEAPWITIQQAASGHLRCTVTSPLPDGEPSTYSLLIKVVRSQREGPLLPSTPRYFTRFVLAVRERGSVLRLPRFCPERHINDDGSFCLGWGAEFDPWPRSRESARHWWKTVCGFVQLQDRASLLRYWPARAWAHGDAAEFENDFEKLAMTLPNSVVAGVKDAHGRGRRLSSRPLCPCGSGRGRSCHQVAVRNLELVLDRIDACEEAYWRDLRQAGARCCGTMDGCSLPVVGLFSADPAARTPAAALGTPTLAPTANPDHP
jgi:hypothetical protein